MFAEILSIVTPVLLLVLIGFFVRLRQPVELTTINRLTIELFCPLLVYSTLSHSTLSLATLSPLLFGTFIIVLGSGALVWVFCRLLHYPVAALCPTSMFNNCGNMGLPLGLFAAGQLGLDIFVAIFVVSNTLHFTLGIWVIGAKVNLKQILLSPMLIATYAGLAANIFSIKLPEPIEISFQMMGDVTIPLMLFALGVRMVDVDWSLLRVGLIGGILCPLSGLLIAVLIAPILNLSATYLQMFFIFAALPPAVLNFLIAERYAIEAKRVASIVLIGNILALIFVPLGLWIGFQLV